tara:strand:+ start:194 stop:652 length:459 start_codon:yes stop_codon:yes gene_type:complete
MPDEVILIAAVTIDGYIARHELEVTTWSKDLPLFKKQTMGFPVIMGSNTFNTLSKELVGRETIVVCRQDKPAEVMRGVSSRKCFVVGGGETFNRFARFLTHLYITPHPFVFGKGVPLFGRRGADEIGLSFIKLVEYNKNKGIYQYQYKVLKT